MIHTESFLESASWACDAKKKAMIKLNQFIEANKIERSDILEFKTNETYGFHESKFEVVISWWK